MTDLPDAVVDAAKDAVIDEFTCDEHGSLVCDCAVERRDKTVRAILAAASGPWAEQLDAANADALREAADEMDHDRTLWHSLEAGIERASGPASAADFAQDEATRWLRDRTDRIENGEQP